MNLADLMNQLADDVDARSLPTPDDIRRTGDTRRRRRRDRVGVAAAVLAVVAVATTLAIVTHTSTRSAPGPVGPIDGWRVVRTLEIPGSGDVFYGDGSLWVVDTGDQELAGDGTPSGDIYQVDPGSGAVLDRVPGAVGGWPSVGAGAIWLSTAAGELDVLTRVDLASHEVTRTSTSHPRQLPHGTAYAAGNLWVANYSSGDLLRMDPETLQVLQTLHLGDVGNGRSPQSLIGDGHSVWVGDDNGLVTRLDGATGEVTSRLQLPVREVRFDGVDTDGHLLYAHGLRGNSVFQIATGPPGPDRIREELPLSQDVGSMLVGFAVGSGSLWAATLNPDRLVRIDPESLRIRERVPLTGIDHTSNVPVALAASGGTVWVRVDDRVLELAPQP